MQVSIGPFLVRVRSELQGVSDYLTRLYPDFPIGTATGGHFDITITGSRGVHRWWRPQANLFVNGTKPFLPLPASLAGGLLEWGMNWCIGGYAHQWVAVHAAVLERGGRTLILSGPSGSGKSTLCAALALAGWRLFSDEFALINVEHGHLTPLPRPISLKEAAIGIMAKRGPTTVFSAEEVDVEDQRFVHMRPPTDSVRRARETAPPGWIVVPRYVAGKPTTIEPVTKAHALIRLTDQSFNYNLLGVEGYRCLTRLVSASECYRLEYSDLDDVIGRLTQMTSH